MMMTAKDHWKKRRIQIVDFARGAIMVGNLGKGNYVSKASLSRRARYRIELGSSEVPHKADAAKLYQRRRMSKVMI